MNLLTPIIFDDQLMLPPVKDSELIERVIKVLRDNIFEGFPGIVQLAANEGVSPTKLKYLFKNVTGNTVYNFFAQCQMETAKSMLLETHEQIKTIAYSLSYKHPGKFTEAFRRQFGVTPTEVRVRMYAELTSLSEKTDQRAKEAV